MRTRCAISILLAATIGQTLAAESSAPPGAVFIAAGGIVDPHGALQAVRGLLLENGTVTRVGGEPGESVRVDRYPGAVLCPGLVDCHALLGVEGRMSERGQAVQPGVDARDALVRHSAKYAAVLRAGVTTFALAPDNENLVGGRIAICNFGADGKPVVDGTPGPFKISLSPEAFKADREPTSRSGALGMLRDALSAAGADKTHALRPLLDPSARVFVVAPSGADVLSAVDLAQQYGLKLAVFHTEDALHVADVLGGRALGAIVGPLDLQASPRQAGAAATLAKHDVPVALAGGLPDNSADGLRIAAAMAARHGLPLPAARSAITRVPAELLGVGERVGSLAPGQRGDVVVFSGDPLDLRSRVLAVYVAGVRVHAEASQNRVASDGVER